MLCVFMGGVNAFASCERTERQRQRDSDRGSKGGGVKEEVSELVVPAYQKRPTHI